MNSVRARCPYCENRVAGSPEKHTESCPKKPRTADEERLHKLRDFKRWVEGLPSEEAERVYVCIECLESTMHPHVLVFPPLCLDCKQYMWQGLDWLRQCTIAAETVS